MAISSIHEPNRAIAEKSEKEGKVGSLESPTEVPEKDMEVSEETDQESPSTEPLPLSKLLLIGLGLWFAVFLVALDQTIVANANPRITDEFKKMSDVGWYGSGYALPNAAFQLFYGRVYSNFSIKYTFLTVIIIFEIGSLVCALAPTSTALIVGRAVAGLGGAGIFSGVMTIIAHAVPVRIRPLFIASMGAVFAIAGVIGPLLGGVFTTKLTWRWCFYINLPFGGLTVFSLLFFFHPPKRQEIESIPFAEKIKKIDLIGLFILLPAIVCLLLGLQWGGTLYAWNSGRVIALFVVFGVLFISFIVFEYWKGPDASLPLRMLARRGMAAAAWNGFCYGGAFPILVFYIPFWHQVIRNVSAADSGIALLPLILGVVVMSLISGVFVSKFGYYNIMMILGSTIAPIGEGLLTTWTVHTGFSHWVGYQALTGMGIGVSQQQPLIATQTLLSKEEIASGSAVIILLQILSGAIFISVGQNVLLNELTKNLHSAFPAGDFDFSGVLRMGATEIRSHIPSEDLPKVLVAYNGALTKVFTVALCLSALSMIGSLAMERKHTEKAKDGE